jgi:hypothetical protein
MAFQIPEPSVSLKPKLTTLAKSAHHRVRLITDDEFAEIKSTVCLEEDAKGWFMFDKRQIVLDQRSNGQRVIFAV